MGFSFYEGAMPAERMTELTTQAHEFALKQLPTLKALQIA